MKESTAPGTGAGFDYQFHYFVYRLLNMKKGQSIGLEIKDDVHSDLDNDVQLLFQLKHTIQTQAGGSPIALTELDGDLWKTLYNWTRVITDPRDGRSEITAQLKFVKRSEFHLVSNKSESKSNLFSQLLIAYSEHASAENLRAVVDRANSLSGSTKDATIKGYIDTVLTIEPSVQQEFLKRVFFQLAETEVIQKVKDTLEEKFVLPEDVDSVYERLSTLIRDDNYFSILAGTLTAITFDDFRTRYRRVVSQAVKKRLSRLQFEPHCPKTYWGSFIKQLIAIDDICEDDSEVITQLSTHKVRMARSLEVWVHGGEVVSDEVTALHKDVTLRWSNKHRKAFKNAPKARLMTKPRPSLMSCAMRRIDWVMMSSAPNNPTGSFTSSRSRT